MKEPKPAALQEAPDWSIKISRNFLLCWNRSMWSHSETLGLGLAGGGLQLFCCLGWWGLHFIFLINFYFVPATAALSIAHSGPGKISFGLGLSVHYNGKKKAWLFLGHLRLLIPMRTVLPLFLCQHRESLMVSSSVRVTSLTIRSKSCSPRDSQSPHKHATTVMLK